MFFPFSFSSFYIEIGVFSNTSSSIIKFRPFSSSFFYLNWLFWKMARWLLERMSVCQNKGHERAITINDGEILFKVTSKVIEITKSENGIRTIEYIRIKLARPLMHAYTLKTKWETKTKYYWSTLSNEITDEKEYHIMYASNVFFYFLVILCVVCVCVYVDGVGGFPPCSTVCLFNMSTWCRWTLLFDSYGDYLTFDYNWSI